jgi:uncharacterized membrane protein YbjE (DUF340 family)
VKTIVVFVSIFIAGLLVGSMNKLPDLFEIESIKTITINGLLLFIGIGVGLDRRAFEQIRKMDIFTMLVPFLIAIGSLVGAGLAAMLMPLVGFRQGLAVGAGFGFYSLSSVIITDLSGAQLGAIALIANLTRELFTILLTPLIVRLFGRLAPIASAGATSMDVCLPVIQRFSGTRYTILAIISGVILTILVPILVPLFL